MKPLFQKFLSLLKPKPRTPVMTIEGLTRLGHEMKAFRDGRPRASAFYDEAPRIYGIGSERNKCPRCLTSYTTVNGLPVHTCNREEEP